MAPAVPDMKDRLARLGTPMHVAIGAAVTNVEFGRFLAKIAHAFATTELGIDGFAPLLLSTIRGEPPALLAWLIGCPIGDEPPSAERHEIGFAKLDVAHVTVGVRLFASQHLPTYYVVAGRRRSAWPKAATAA